MIPYQRKKYVVLRGPYGNRFITTNNHPPPYPYAGNEGEPGGVPGGEYQVLGYVDTILEGQVMIYGKGQGG